VDLKTRHLRTCFRQRCEGGESEGDAEIELAEDIGTFQCVHSTALERPACCEEGEEGAEARGRKALAVNREQR